MQDLIPNLKKRWKTILKKGKIIQKDGHPHILGEMEGVGQKGGIKDVQRDNEKKLSKKFGNWWRGFGNGHGDL
jgi:hypothetical protein